VRELNTIKPNNLLYRLTRVLNRYILYISNNKSNKIDTSNYLIVKLTTLALFLDKYISITINPRY